MMKRAGTSPFESSMHRVSRNFGFIFLLIAAIEAFAFGLRGVIAR